MNSWQKPNKDHKYKSLEGKGLFERPANVCLSSMIPVNLPPSRWAFCLVMILQTKTGAWFNTLRPRKNGRHFPNDIFKWIFLKENVWISIKINSLKFLPRGPISNIPALVQIMAWRRPGDKPLSKPMTVSLLTHICVTRPQWVNIKMLSSQNRRSHCWYNTDLR